MADFSRQFLLDNGVPAENIDAIMAARNKTLTEALAAYVPKADVQAQIDAAIKAIPKPEIPDVKASPEYGALLQENNKLKAFQGDDFSSVKAPYRDMVWEKLDHSEKHKPYAEQLTAMAETMPDLFAAKEPAPPEKPQFGAPTGGSAPSGKQGPSFMDTWGFVPKK